MSEEYHKIQTVFLRDPANNHKTLLEGQFAKPEFDLLRNIRWVWTEKIDGTNIRVIWDGEKVTFGGKTDNAQIPAFLVNRLRELFPDELMPHIFDGPATLYGEGYGAKIQKGGGNYIPDGQDFILFDVFCGGLWLERSNVIDIAGSIGISSVPEIARGDLMAAVNVAKGGFNSRISKNGHLAEGLVMRPERELLNRRGERIIAKVKYKDFVR